MIKITDEADRQRSSGSSPYTSLSSFGFWNLGFEIFKIKFFDILGKQFFITM